MMEENFLAAKQAIETAQNILFTTHENTDGDDLGSVLALALHAKSMGKKVSLVISGGVPSRLHFLPMSEDVTTKLDVSNQYDLLIISGCSNIERVANEQIKNLGVPIINIDHHPDNQKFGAINLVDSNKSAVAELVYDFFQFCNWPITNQVATCLLTGIVTDTGLFMHSNTKAETLDAASDLLSKGARIREITKHTFATQKPDQLKAWGMGMANSYLDRQNQVIYSVITQENIKDLKEIELANFEGLVETLNKVPEAKYSILLKETDDKIRGSLRSDPHKGVDVKEIAQRLGGGGHKWAAGFSLQGKPEKKDDGSWRIISEGREIDFGNKTDL